MIPAYYSIERRITLLALGAEIVVTKAEKGVPVRARAARLHAASECCPACTLPAALLAGSSCKAHRACATMPC